MGRRLGSVGLDGCHDLYEESQGVLNESWILFDSYLVWIIEQSEFYFMPSDPLFTNQPNNKYIRFMRGYHILHYNVDNELMNWTNF